MTYTLEELNEKMKRNGGSLDLRGCASLTSLPEGQYRADVFRRFFEEA